MSLTLQSSGRISSGTTVPSSLVQVSLVGSDLEQEMALSLQNLMMCGRSGELVKVLLKNVSDGVADESMILLALLANKVEVEPIMFSISTNSDDAVDECDNLVVAPVILLC